MSQPIELDLERYRRDIKRRTGLDAVELALLAWQAEENGASPHEVRAILDGDLSWLER